VSASRVPSVVVLVTLFAGCTGKTRHSADSSFEATATVQAHVNGYFHSQVIPRLTDCWKNLAGEGTVQMVHRFAKVGGDWAPQKVEVNASTVRAEVARAAAQCMETAVQGTTLPKEGIATAESELFLHWTWPVPFPPEQERSPSLLYLGVGGGSGGGGCDGRGAQPQCKNCVDVNGNRLKTLECATVCVGYEHCTEEAGPSGVIDTCRLSGNCASGGPFGSVGVVLY
jgi:hypothetical protein